MALNQDAKDILKAGIGISNALSDGFQFGDIGALMDLPAAISGWAVGVENLKESVGTEEGRAEIEAYVKQEFDIPDDVLEEKIEKTVAWLNATYDLYLTWSEPTEEEPTEEE